MQYPCGSSRLRQTRTTRLLQSGTQIKQKKRMKLIGAGTSPYVRKVRVVMA